MEWRLFAGIFIDGFAFLHLQHDVVNFLSQSSRGVVLKEVVTSSVAQMSLCFFHINPESSSRTVADPLSAGLRCETPLSEPSVMYVYLLCYCTALVSISFA